jgi:hypothetical protein
MNTAEPIPHSGPSGSGSSMPQWDQNGWRKDVGEMFSLGRRDNFGNAPKPKKAPLRRGFEVYVVGRCIRDNAVSKSVGDPTASHGSYSLEAAMLHVTDHWFLRPSVWNRSPKDRRANILAELKHSDASAINWTRFSIFDEIRANLLDELEEATPESVRTADQPKSLSFERAKVE